MTVTGETSCAEDIETTIDNEVNKVEIREEVAEEGTRLTPENIEQLRKIIKDAVDNVCHKEDVLNFGNTKDDNQIKDEDNRDEKDNIEEAKRWAVGQKQSLSKSEIYKGSVLK